MQSSKILLNLYNIKDKQEFTNILLNNIKSLENNDDNKNEILFIIYSIISDTSENPFIINKNIDESLHMPSGYLMNNIRESIKNENDPKLLLSIILSLSNKNWSKIHPEHLRLILLGLKQYKENLLLNKVIMEILEINELI